MKTPFLGIALVSCISLLGGCAGTPPTIETVTQTKVVTPNIPAGLLTCMPEPPIPAMTMQSEAIELTVKIDEAGEDCRLHLQAVSTALAKPAQ